MRTIECRRGRPQCYTGDMAQNDIISSKYIEFHQSLPYLNRSTDHKSTKALAPNFMGALNQWITFPQTSHLTQYNRQTEVYTAELQEEFFSISNLQMEDPIIPFLGYKDIQLWCLVQMVSKLPTGGLPFMQLWTVVYLCYQMKSTQIHF